MKYKVMDSVRVLELNGITEEKGGIKRNFKFVLLVMLQDLQDLNYLSIGEARKNL